jgi:hypothetical protein
MVKLVQRYHITCEQLLDYYQGAQNRTSARKLLTLPVFGNVPDGVE